MFGNISVVLLALKWLMLMDSIQCISVDDSAAEYLRFLNTEKVGGGSHHEITQTNTPRYYGDSQHHHILIFVLMLHKFAGAVPWGQFGVVTICGYASCSPLLFCLGNLGGHCSR